MTPHSRSLIRLVPLLLVVTACQGTDQSTAPDMSATEVRGRPAPAPMPLVVVSANSPQAATVGAFFSYDATKGGSTFGGGNTSAPLTYAVTFAPTANGFTATNGRISGTPAASAVTTVTLTARDASGQSASTSFAIVAFAADLTAPLLTTAFGYADASTPLPAHFLAGAGPGGSVIATDNTPLDNRTTDAGAALGRVLFYDRRLSVNDKIACASCHQQRFGFSDTARFSTGFDGELTEYHSPGLSNARFYRRGRFFWDERAATLEAQVLQPVQSPVEMGQTLTNLVTKLNATSYYPALYQRAFGSSDITADRTARALAQFVRSIVSASAKYDQAFASRPTPNFAAVFTPQELLGQQLFNGQAGCARCHQTDAQLLDEPHNTGLDLVTADTGAGRGRFKSPSLRDAAVRGHYMHDGRFSTLAQVVDFYNAGVQANPDLDPRLRGPNGAPQRLNLTATQKAALVAYLETLTDTGLQTAARFSSPFPR